MIHTTKHKYTKIVLALVSVSAWFCIGVAPAYAVLPADGGGGPSSAAPAPADPTTVNLGDPATNHQCGSGDGAVKTTINFGCKGEGCPKSDPVYCSGNNSGILDLTFAIIRFLSYGVGLVVIASIIVAGIQYTSSQGDPKATAAAETRIKATVIALLIYIFGYAILNYVLPSGFLK